MVSGLAFKMFQFIIRAFINSTKSLEGLLKNGKRIYIATLFSEKIIFK